MSWANPWALLWGLAAIVVVGLYWRCARAARVPTGTDPIWAEVLAEQPIRTAWQRWRHGVSLAAQLAILAAIVLALAGPRFSPPEQIVLVLDNSSEAMADLKQKAKKWIDTVGPGDRMALVTAGGTASVQCNLTGERTLIEERLDGIKPAEGPPRIEAARVLAGKLATDGKTIVLAAEDGSVATRAAEPWLCLVGLAVLLLTVEWGLYQRRWMS